MKQVNTDLHIHTCLSPCGDLEMTPLNIVRFAVDNKLDMIAICDHNSAENAAAVRKASTGTDLKVLSGIEATSAEEVHVLGIFDRQEGADEFQSLLYRHLPSEENDEKIFGLQVVADEKEEVTSINKKLLISATDLSLKEIVDAIHNIGGIVIASHIDRSVYSVISQLGFIPEDIDFDALEVSNNASVWDRETYHKNFSLPVIQSSDAHFLKDIGRGSTCFHINSRNLDEIKLALKSKKGRKITL